MSNTPDDWGCYYTRCGRCGARYHASEGGCDCRSEYDGPACICGRCEWDDDLWNVDANTRCTECLTGPEQRTLVATTYHTARKPHGLSIKPGDRYRRLTWRHYYPNGPWGRWNHMKDRIEGE